MSDGDMKFPPGKRREIPKFEPPPWEREQFEKLARTREARDEKEPDQVPDEGRNDQQEEGAGTAPPEPAANEGKAVPQLDEEQVALLLSGLRAEEPRAAEGYWKISMATGIILSVIGLAVTTWGVVALLTPKESGATGGVLVTGLLVPGLGFLGGGIWLVINSLRRQGVL